MCAENRITPRNISLPWVGEREFVAFNVGAEITRDCCQIPHQLKCSFRCRLAFHVCND